MNFIKDESKAAWKYIWTFVKWLFIAGVTGIVGGLVGTAFNLSVSWATGTRMAHPWLLLLLPVSGLLIAGLYRLTKMENENTNAIIDSIHFGDKVPLMLVPAIFISTTITHLFGGSAGREGAALQIGGSLGCYIGRAFHLDDKDMRLATLCGMSAVFAALFGTPLTATLFALEVISVGVIYYSALVPCIVASLFALEMANIFGIAPTHFDVVIEPISELMLLKVSVLAIVCSLMSTVFCLSMHKTEHLFAKLIKNPYLRIAAGGGPVLHQGVFGVGLFVVGIQQQVFKHPHAEDQAHALPIVGDASHTGVAYLLGGAAAQLLPAQQDTAGGGAAKP